MPTETQVITRESMTKALEQVVENRGRDYVYPNNYCSYQEGGEPSCMFGQALEILGVPYNEAWEDDNIGAVLHMLGVEDEHLLRVCDMAQRRQDDHDPYGEVLDRFHELLAVL